MISIAYTLLALIWGSTWMFIKIGLNDFPPMTFAAVRFVLTAVLMFLVLIASKKLKNYKQLFSWPAIIFGVFNGFAYALVFEGENYISSSLTAVLNAAMPFTTLILATIFVGERLTMRKTIGLLCGFTGIIFLYWRDLSHTSSGMMLGGGMIILSTVIYATGAIIAKKYPSNNGVLEVVSVQMAATAIVLVILAVILEPYPRLQWTQSSIFSLLYLAVIGSALAFVLYYYLLKNIEVSKLSYVSMITPVVAVVFGVFFLGEPFTITYLWTLLAVLAGMYIISR